jgi:hypothetical protein
MFAWFRIDFSTIKTATMIKLQIIHATIKIIIRPRKNHSSFEEDVGFVPLLAIISFIFLVLDRFCIQLLSLYDLVGYFSLCLTPKRELTSYSTCSSSLLAKQSRQTFNLHAWRKATSGAPTPTTPPHPYINFGKNYVYSEILSWIRPGLLQYHTRSI